MDHSLTCDICGRELKSFMSMQPGCSVFNRWHNATPSLKAWARSKAVASGFVALWSAGRIWHLTNQSTQLLHSSAAILELPSCSADTKRYYISFITRKTIYYPWKSDSSVRLLVLIDFSCRNHLFRADWTHEPIYNYALRIISETKWMATPSVKFSSLFPGLDSHFTCLFYNYKLTTQSKFSK